VTSRNIYFLVVLAVFLVALATVFFVYVRRARKTSEGTWESLLHRLKFVDRGNVARIALDIMHSPDHSANEEEEFPLDPADIWSMIGGLEGLEVLRHNCAVLVDLAFYVQTWHPEALVVAEQLRLNAREIEWHLTRLEGAAKTGNLESAFPNYAQRAIATYYVMTQSVLSLYERGNLPEFAALQGAI
jgi:hypothetical protein